MNLNDVSRELAALVAVVSIAMVATNVNILRCCWSRFETNWVNLSRPVWRFTSSVALFAGFAPISLLILFVLYRVENQNYLIVSVFKVVAVVVLLLFGLLLLVNVGIAMKSKIKKKIIIELDSNTGFYFAALLYMVFSVFFNIGALIGVSHTMLLLTIGPFEPVYFDEWGKWWLYIGTFAFAVGLGLFGIGFLFDKGGQWKNKLSKDNQK